VRNGPRGGARNYVPKNNRERAIKKRDWIEKREKKTGGSTACKTTNKKEGNNK
jgi:hypothetical protein